MNEQEFSSQQLSAIKSSLRKFDSYRNGMVIGQVVLEISRKFCLHPLVAMEKIFRRIGSCTYLVAIPLDNQMARDFIAKLPHSGDQEYNHYLWVCVNGLKEMQEKMAEVETDPERNLQNLANTGMLLARRGTQISQIIQSPNN